MLPEPPTDTATAVRFIANDPLRPELRTPTASSTDGATVHQRFKRLALVAAPWLEHKGHRLAVTFGAHV